MNRPVSPIRHDYKHAMQQPARPARRLAWFAAGLGLPLTCLMVVLALRDAGDDVRPASPDDTGVRIADSLIIPAAEFSPRAESLAEALAPFVATPEIEPYTALTLKVSRGDTLDRLFRRNSLSIPDLAVIAALPEAKQPLRLVRPGDRLEIRHDEGRVRRLYKELDLASALLVEAAEDGGFRASIVDRPVDAREILAHGVIDSSLFEAAAAAGMSDKVIMNLAGIFAWDVDFVLDIRKGDQFYILYEQLWQDGEFVGDGEIIAAEFVNNGRNFQAIRFVDPEGRSDYYTPEGRSVRKAFVRAPVDFSRISSNFNPRRRHPVLNTIRAHRGVDYAAPTGTPIKAAGDGKVIFRGRKGGYGNTVILQHGGNITTLYAHMSRFAGKARMGSRVKQGQIIGYVGATGLVTAPHLHYEYRVNGVHRNPRTVKLPQAEPIRESYRQDFLATAEPLIERLNRYKTTRLASLQ